MPIVISLLNAFTGLAAAASGSGRTQPGGLQRAATNLFHLTAPVAR
jgi:hypothetical protein